MLIRSKVLAIGLALPAVLASAAVCQQKMPAEPPLPVVKYDACPFEGCTFRKWIAIKDATIFNTWQTGRKPVGSLKKGEVVGGLTGVFITLEPDRGEVLVSIPDLKLDPGDAILRYAEYGEGSADYWTKNGWVTYNASDAPEVSIKLISHGQKEWWVQIKTRDGKTGWLNEGDSGVTDFDCMDQLAGDEEKCRRL